MSAREPTAGRPRFPPGYGISDSTDGMLPWSWAVDRLDGARNYWVVTAGSTGKPHAMPVWGLWFDDGVLFSTSSDSRKGRDLAADPRAVVHLESGDEVVVLEGEVASVTLDERMADAYEEKYSYRPEPGQGLWFLLAPTVAYCWLESDYPRTATRFVFG